MKLSTVLTYGPLAIAAVVLAIANRAPVRLTLDPFNPQNPGLSVEMPLFVAVFLALILGMLLGGLIVWFAQGRWRRRARAERREVRKLQREAEKREASLAPAPGTAVRTRANRI